MDNLVTCDLIMDWIQDQVEQKIPISPHVYLDAAQKLVVLVGDEQEKLFELQQQVAQIKVKSLEEGDSVAKAKTKVEASDVYKDMQRQKAKIDRVHEFVRTSKLQARVNMDEFKGY